MPFVLEQVLPFVGGATALFLSATIDFSTWPDALRRAPCPGLSQPLCTQRVLCGEKVYIQSFLSSSCPLQDPMASIMSHLDGLILRGEENALCL